MLKTLVEGLDYLLFSSPCGICGRGEGPICLGCRAEILDGRERCRHCAMPIGPYMSHLEDCSWCRGRSLGFDGAITLGPYTGAGRGLCLRLKSLRNAWLGRWGVSMLWGLREPEIRGWQPDLVVPVPLHWQRHLLRGYNQSRDLAERLAASLGLPCARAVRRVKRTSKLAGRGQTARIEQMRGAFEPSPRADLNGRSVLLVDDILTTGATAGACARALKKGGAKTVNVVVLARAEAW